jgi:hypothetical protein
MIRQVFGEESMSCMQVFESYSRFRASHKLRMTNNHQFHNAYTVAKLQQLVCEDT